MSIARGIAKITDTQSAESHILLSCSLADAAALAAPAIGPAGSVVGTATFANGGMNPGSAGSVLFSNIDPNNQLRHEGQITMTVSTAHMAEADTSGQVSMSRGENKAATQWLFTFRTSGSVNQGNLAVNAAEQIKAQLHPSDTQSTAYISTVGKGSFVEVCVWWKGADWGILADGGEIHAGTRTNFADNIFYKVYIGATNAGTSGPLANATIKNLIITRRAPRFVAKRKAISVGFFGNSFIVNASAANTTPSFDNNIEGAFGRKLSAYGYGVSRWVQSGYGGYSMCDTGASDLSANFDTYAANKCDVDIIVAGENDSTATAAQVADGATGTDANFKSLIGKLITQKSDKQLIIVTTPGSLRQHTAIDTVANNANRVTVDAIIKALPAWFDSTYPALAGRLVVYDLFTALGGDADGNLNYQGACDALGNLATGGSAAPVSPIANRHPSSYGQDIWLEAVAEKIRVGF